MGASTVKWTCPDPCLELSESDSKLYTNFNFCEEKTIDIKKILIYKAIQFMMTKKRKISKKSSLNLENDASGVQVGDIEQIIV